MQKSSCFVCFFSLLNVHLQHRKKINYCSTFKLTLEIGHCVCLDIKEKHNLLLLSSALKSKNKALNDNKIPTTTPLFYH